MLIEAPVLGSDKSSLHMHRDVGESDPCATLVLLEHFGKRLTCAVEQDACARQLQALELGVIGQVGGRLVVAICLQYRVEGSRTRRWSRTIVISSLCVYALASDETNAGTGA